MTAGTRLGVWLIAAALTGCAYAPAYRPIGPPLDDKVFEAGIGAHGVIGQDLAGGGTSGWMQTQIAKDVSVVARGHFTQTLPWRGGGGFLQDAPFGGGLGLRGSYRAFDDLYFGGELLLDYTQFRSSAEGTVGHFLSGAFGFPVAERALPDLWVYVEPTIGAGWRFGDVDVPFGGYMEVPIGVAWRPKPNLMVVGEAGFAIPFAGGYGGVAVALRL